MKKKNLFMALAALFVLAFASCNNEPEITGPGIDDGGNDKQPTEGIFSWEFSTSFGEFTTQDVLGDESWMIDFKTAKMTGYINATKENRANEDWLISPAIKLENVTAAKLKMEYVAQYFDNLSTDITVQVSENYTEGAPSTAQWTEVKPASALVEGTDWNTFATTEYSLTSYVGKTIRFAIKYVSTDTKAGTIEVKSVAVEEGEAAGESTELTGKGTKEEPYTVSDVISLNNSIVGPFYVKGYIVGQVVGQSLDSGSEFVAPWTPSTNQNTGELNTYNTNILIAVSIDETDVKNVVPVQLPSGELRNALNLPENGDMYQKEILVYGNLEAYFRVPGVKSPTYAVVDGVEYGLNPDEPIVEPEATPVTIAEFIEASESEEVYYELTGTISAGEGSINTTYGNFDLVDETGSVYVYGLTATYIPAGGQNDKSYASLGLNEGDNITIRGYRGSYNGKVEVMGAYFVKKN